jgi:peptide/nickel transport system substrate-binding protein
VAPADDHEVWEFTLRQGVSYHNGNPLTANDVVFSLERAMMPTTNMLRLRLPPALPVRLPALPVRSTRTAAGR